METVCPFPIVDFYEQNKGLVKKFLRKNTLGLKIEDWDYDEIPETWWYKNKEGLLRSGVKRSEDDYTLYQKLEWIKCAVDVSYYTKKHIKIISVDDGLVPFNLYDYQEDLLTLYQKHRHVLSMQCRQSGKTITTATFLGWYGIFNEAKTIAVLANKADQAQEILERIQLTYENLPLFLQPGVKVYNKRTVVFGNNSKIFSAASSSSSIRGKSVSLLYIDEAAFIPNDMQFYESTYPTISSGKKTRIIITSTPNGTRGMFYKLWQESLSNTNSYKRMEVPWWLVPGRDEKWKEEEISNTSREQFRQEHELHFRGSQDSLLPGHVLEEMVVREPEEYHENLKVYSLPKEKHSYVICVDCSEGVGGDYHGVIVIDLSTKPYEVAAVYHDNKLSPLLLPNLLYNIGTNYNEALVLIENESTGSQVGTDLYYDLEYENTLMTITEKNKQVIGFSANGRIGVKMSKQVKAIGCSTIKTLIEKGKFNANDSQIIHEFGTFVPKGGSYAAAQGCHDDLVMPLVMFGWLSTQAYFIDLTDIDLRKNLFESLNERSVEEVLPFGIIDDGIATFDGNSYREHNEFSMKGF